MKEGLLISHELEDEFTPVKVVDVDISDTDVDMMIYIELSKWDFPPENYTLVHDNDMIQIVYKDGRIDPVVFRTSEVDVDIFD